MMTKTFNDHYFLIVLSLIAITLTLPMLANNLAIGLFLVFFILNFKHFKIQGFTFLYALPLIIIVLDIISVANSVNINDALLILEKRSALVIFSIAFLILPKVSNKNLNVILKSFIYSLVVVCVFSLVCALIENFKIYGFKFNYQSVWLIGHHKLSAHIDFHATYLSNYILFVLGVLFFYKNEDFKINRNLKYAILIFLIFYFLLLSVRTTFVTFIVLSFFYLYTIFKHNKVKLLIGLLIGALSFTVLFFNSTMLRERFEDIFSVGKSMEKSRFGGSEIRMYNWESAYSIFKENPIFGVGNGDVSNKLNEKYQALEQHKYDLTDLNSHNQYLNALASKGILGFASILLFLGLSFFMAVKTNNKLFIILIIIHMISFLSENILTRNKGIVFLFFFYGLLCSNIDFNILNKKES